MGWKEFFSRKTSRSVTLGGGGGRARYDAVPPSDDPHFPHGPGGVGSPAGGWRGGSRVGDPGSDLVGGSDVEGRANRHSVRSEDEGGGRRGPRTSVGGGARPRAGMNREDLEGGRGSVGGVGTHGGAGALRRQQDGAGVELVAARQREAIGDGSGEYSLPRSIDPEDSPHHSGYGERMAQEGGRGGGGGVGAGASRVYPGRLISEIQPVEEDEASHGDRQGARAGGGRHGGLGAKAEVGRSAAGGGQGWGGNSGGFDAGGAEGGGGWPPAPVVVGAVLVWAGEVHRRCGWALLLVMVVTAALALAGKAAALSG